MKYIQVIDGALNCTYSLFSMEDEDFVKLFPDGTDVEFNDELFDRLGEVEASQLLAKIWEKPINKKSVTGIHGTLFYGMGYKKKYYPTKRESEMIVAI